MKWSAKVLMRLGRLRLDVDIESSAPVVAVIGPNGAGKSSLLRVFTGAHRPAEGRIVVGDAVLYDSARGIDLAPEDRGLGYVPQGFGLFPHLSALDNVGFAWLGRVGTSRDERRRLARAVLDDLDCAYIADRDTLTLSGGEKQRIALARAVAAAPGMLLLDEPLSALDASARRSVRQFLGRTIARHAGPAIVVTHDARDVRALGARVLVLEEGRVVQQGPVEQVSEQPATAFVEEFFGV